MPHLLVRDLDARTMARLKKRAEEHQRSLQGEVRAILQAAATKMTRKEFVAATERWQLLFKGRRFSDSAALIRRDRNR
jgi:plasmid stability protein